MTRSSRARGNGPKAGFELSQVVHNYGDICQTITEVAAEQNLTVTAREFQTLNRCLDTAIAQAIAEHARLTAQARSNQEVDRLRCAADEVRDLLETAIFGLNALKRGAVPIDGGTVAALGRSLMSVRGVIDRTLSDVRLAAGGASSSRSSPSIPAWPFMAIRCS